MSSFTPEEDGKPYHVNADVSHRIVVTAAVFVVIEVLTTILRIWARRMQKTGFMWSDLFVPLSLLFNIGVCTCAFLAVRWGAGKHRATLPNSDIPSFMVLSYYGMTEIYLFAITFSRLAVLDLYLNIFLDRFSRWTTWVVAAMIVGSLVGNFVAIIDRCSAPHELWNPTPGGWCLSIREHCTWASFPNIVTDFLMLVLPLPVVYRLRTTWQKKLGVLLTFVIGSFGLATSIIRFVKFWQLGWQIMYSDPTWASVDVFVWTVIEPGVYHVAACCITYGSIIRWLFKDSPLSSSLSKIHPTANRSGDQHSTSSSFRNLRANGSGDLADYRSDPMDFVPHDRGFSESSVVAEQGTNGHEEFERRIIVETGFDVTQSRAWNEKASPSG